MANSLLAGVSGLAVHQQMLEVVGNNLANTNTTAFKAQTSRFADLVYQTVAGATASSGNVGGTNPQQLGFGVGFAGIDSDFAQGRREEDGNPLHMAIQGNGFFQVNDGTRLLYTRSGSFDVDSNGFLVDPGTGFKVQRFGAVGESGAANVPVFQTVGNPSIRIPFGTGIAGAATSRVTLQGNLSANLTGPAAGVLTSSAPFLDGSIVGNPPAVAGTLLNNLTGNTINYAGADTINIAGVNANGTVIAGTYTPVGAASTMADLLAAINALYNTGPTGATATLSPAGNIVLTANSTGPESLSMNLTDAAGNIGATTFPSLTKTTVGKNGDTLSSAIQVFDVQGTIHNLSLTFTKQAPNLWNLAATIPAADGIMIDGSVTGITFNDNGSLLGVTGTGVGDPNIQLQITGLAAPQTIDFSFGTLNGFDGLTGFGGASSSAAIGQDGFSAGNLSSVAVNGDGIINGIFSNGKTFQIAQIALATFANVSGLQREGNNAFSESGASGIALIGSGGSGGRGSIRPGALESSNVDVATELTRLVIAQRGFQASARTIRTSNEILDELANIIR